MKKWSVLAEWEKVCMFNVTGRRESFPKRVRSRADLHPAAGVSDTGLKQEWKEAEPEEVTAHRRQLWLLSCKKKKNPPRTARDFPQHVSQTAWRRRAGPSSLGLCFIFSCCRWANWQTFPLYNWTLLTRTPTGMVQYLKCFIFLHLHSFFFINRIHKPASTWFPQLNSLKNEDLNMFIVEWGIKWRSKPH